nr:MAG TPA: hypothetical protein [Crassvirales sp.]
MRRRACENGFCRIFSSDYNQIIVTLHKLGLI